MRWGLWYGGWPHGRLRARAPLSVLASSSGSSKTTSRLPASRVSFIRSSGVDTPAMSPLYAISPWM